MNAAAGFSSEISQVMPALMILVDDEVLDLRHHHLLEVADLLEHHFQSPPSPSLEDRLEEVDALLDALHDRVGDAAWRSARGCWPR